MRNHQDSRKYLTLVATVAIGLAINWLSEMYRPGALIAIVLAVVGLMFMYYAENAKNNFLSRLDLSDEPARLVQLALLALIGGAVIAALWLIPIWPSQTWSLTLWGLQGEEWKYITGPFTVFGYEVGAGLCIAGPGVFAAVRGTPIRTVGIYAVSSYVGMSLSQVFMRQETLFLPTLMGWSVVCVMLALIARSMRGAKRTVADFLNISSAGRAQTAPGGKIPEAVVPKMSTLNDAFRDALTPLADDLDHEEVTPSGDEVCTERDADRSAVTSGDR
jgi:hypothetical protein